MAGIKLLRDVSFLVHGGWIMNKGSRRIGKDEDLKETEQKNLRGGQNGLFRIHRSLNLSLLPFLPLSEWEVNTFWTLQITGLVYQFGFLCFQFQNSISGLVLVCSLYRKKKLKKFMPYNLSVFYIDLKALKVRDMSIFLYNC